MYRFTDCCIVGMCGQCEHKHLDRHNLNALLDRPNEDGMKPLAGQYDFQRQPCAACGSLSALHQRGARKPFWRQAADAVPWTYFGGAFTASGRQIEGSDTE
jgi:hypothetical protein